MTTEQDQAMNLTCSSSGASRLLALLTAFDDDDEDNNESDWGIVDDVSWHPCPCAPKDSLRRAVVDWCQVDQGDTKFISYLLDEFPVPRGCSNWTDSRCRCTQWKHRQSLPTLKNPREISEGRFAYEIYLLITINSNTASVSKCTRWF